MLLSINFSDSCPRDGCSCKIQQKKKRFSRGKPYILYITQYRTPKLLQSLFLNVQRNTGPTSKRRWDWPNADRDRKKQITSTSSRLWQASLLSARQCCTLGGLTGLFTQHHFAGLSDAHETAAWYGVVHGLSGRTTGFLRTTGGFLHKSQGGRMTSDEVCFWELQGESLSLFLRKVFWHQESDTSAKWVRF